jgi:hypothetical protein
VGNGVIGWLVVSQKRLNFWMKQNCKVQDKMGCNGLGNRCSIPELSTHWSTRCLRLVDVDFESNSLGNTSHISCAALKPRGRTHGKNAERKLDEMR